MTPSSLFIVGAILDDRAWEFVGVFESEALAREAATQPNAFIGPATLNERAPDDAQLWPGAYFPNA